MGSSQSSTIKRPSESSSRGSIRSSVSSIATSNCSSRASTSSNGSVGQVKSLLRKKRKKAHLIANRYVVGELLGQGSSALVRAASDRITGNIRAVKIIDAALKDHWGKLAGAVDQDLLKTMTRGEGIWRRIGAHEHCVELLDSVLQSGKYYMVMQKCDASLRQKMCVVQRETDDVIAHLLRNMISGIQRVHEVGVVHRDVKPNNFLITGAGGPCRYWCVKLCDFGLATYLPTQGLLHNPAGTVPYMSPEMLDNRGYTEKTDMWSLGVTAYLMVCKDFPYWPSEATPKEEDIKRAIIEGRPRPRFLRASDGDRDERCRKPLSAELTSFIELLLQRSEHLRCSASEALSQPFLNTPDSLSMARNSHLAKLLLQQEESGCDWTRQRSAPATSSSESVVSFTKQVVQEKDIGGAASAPAPLWAFSSREAAECSTLESPKDQPTSPMSHMSFGRSLSRSSERSSSNDSHAPVRLDSVDTCVSTTPSLGSLDEEVYQRPAGQLRPSRQ